ncbi:S41 family peptidase [Catenovulum sediminis]|uniref:S41 family peptidase n=1 Tax=Catenovulum sediminis TaxID=1740262 RepID=A0ABV1RH01_9ALTE|nr:S41 family peptidase [Catenovulum sediminis]
MFQKFRLGVWILSSSLLASCGGSDNTDNSKLANSSCSRAAINQHWYQTLQNDYLWLEELQTPQNAFSQYPTTNTLLADVLPVKDRFSVALSTDDWDGLISGSEFGFGIQLSVSDDKLFVFQTFTGSSAHLAGIQRGQEIISIGDIPASTFVNWLNNADIQSYHQAFGPDQAGYQLTFSWRDLNQQEQVAVLEKSAFKVNSLADNKLIQTNAGTVAYLAFPNGFLESTADELDAVFANIKQQDFDHFVLDLRHNTGGLLSASARLALYLAGERIDRQTFIEIEHNANNAEFNASYTAEDLIWSNLNNSDQFQDYQNVLNNSLNLDSLIVLTNKSTASASETLINSLDIEAYLDVTVIGEQTFGKPVGFYPDEYCDETLLALNFQTNNALGFGDYLNGIPVDSGCDVTDSNMPYPWGSTDDPIVHASINYLQSGVCKLDETAEKTAHKPIINGQNQRTVNIPRKTLPGMLIDR